MAAVSAVAGFLILATGSLAAAVPASASTPRLGGREAAQLTLANVGDGVHVKIQGGGGGTSNCTNDETSKEFTTGSAPGPVQETLSFDAKSSGSCAFEPSFSYFEVSVTGRNTRGTEYVSRDRVWLGQDGAGGPYRAECAPTVQTRMVCQATGPRSLNLDAIPLNPPGHLKTGSVRSVSMRLFGVGDGPRVTIQGGGAGTSNCTNDETNKSLIARSEPIVETLSFDSKASGSCAFEPSYSYFRITVTGRNTEGREFESSANVFYGQHNSGAAPYETSCESQFLVRMRCQAGPELQLEALPLR
jgi:hypothetical protein